MAPRPKRPVSETSRTDRLSIRIDFASGARIGPGKVAVLEAIEQAGSISGAGRALKMSYRRTWELVEELNRTLGAPVVDTAAGGTGGGGASLTRLGQAVIACYRAVETDSMAAASKHIAALHRECAKVDEPGPPGHGAAADRSADP